MRVGWGSTSLWTLWLVQMRMMTLFRVSWMLTPPGNTVQWVNLSLTALLRRLVSRDCSTSCTVSPDVDLSVTFLNTHLWMQNWLWPDCQAFVFCLFKCLFFVSLFPPDSWPVLTCELPSVGSIKVSWKIDLNGTIPVKYGLNEKKQCHSNSACCKANTTTRHLRPSVGVIMSLMFSHV